MAEPTREEPPTRERTGPPPAKTERRHEQRSLFGEILDWMLAPLLLLWPMSVVLTWLVAQNIANRPFDRGLGDMVRVLSRQVSIEAAANAPPDVRFALPVGAEELLRTDGADDIYYQVSGLRGELLSGVRELPPPPPEELAVPGEVRFRDDTLNNEPVRVAYLWVPAATDITGRRTFLPAGRASTAASAALPGIAPTVLGTTPVVALNNGPMPLVQVAETLGKRSRLATEIIKGVILPQFVILPLAVLLVWLALARGIAPLNELQRRIRSRESHDLSPIDEREAPEEVSPLVRAINDLLGRLDQSIRAQKHFLADAAHQLKTPLAGLRTQAELAQREIDDGHADPQQLKKSLKQIAHSSQRAAHMVNQLLAMARAEDRENATRKQLVSLSRLAPQAVREFVPRALEKRIDLGYEGVEPSTLTTESPGLLVSGQSVLLRELIRNLVDNALNYTPSGGTVTVRVVDDPFGQVVVLQVEDSGPGIAVAEREQVFRPFYRGPDTQVDGSGLGLAIVHEIALAHQAEVMLEDTQPRSGASTHGQAPGAGPGARCTVRFPVAHADAAASSASA
ncbi:MAG: putative transrane sensor histidine kinase transcription regulator protein [Rhizobacter sp.]|nr:putative transrane sensor histidine kinase transcription regulator protein [Rhizobacter sp.]